MKSKITKQHENPFRAHQSVAQSRMRERNRNASPEPPVPHLLLTSVIAFAHCIPIQTILLLRKPSNATGPRTVIRLTLFTGSKSKWMSIKPCPSVDAVDMQTFSVITDSAT